MRRNYGLTVDAYEALGDAQSWKCAICESLMSQPHIDHDHTTGRVRALLCFLCNSGLGKFKDDPLLVQRAAEYLKEHSVV